MTNGRIYESEIALNMKSVEVRVESNRTRWWEGYKAVAAVQGAFS